MRHKSAVVQMLLAGVLLLVVVVAVVVAVAPDTGGSFCVQSQIRPVLLALRQLRFAKSW